jgi:hypothetical protein
MMVDPLPPPPRFSGPDTRVHQMDLTYAVFTSDITSIHTGVMIRLRAILSYVLRDDNEVQFNTIGHRDD